MPNAIGFTRLALIPVFLVVELAGGGAGTGALGATLFAAIGDLIITGPTLTNVNDIRAILII